MFLNLLLAGLVVLCTTAAINASPLIKRDSAGSLPLFGPSGLPQLEDLETHHLDNAYVVAVMALTANSPEYVKSLLDPGSGDEEIWVSVWTLDVPPKAYKINIFPEYASSRNDSKGDVWWPGALYQAPIYMKIVHDPEGKGGMPVIPLLDAMIILTGKTGDWKEPKDIDELWELVHHANDSPMMLATKFEDCDTLTCSYTYAILQTEGESTTDGDNRKVRMVDPSSRKFTISLEDLYSDTYYVAYWTDFPSFKDVRDS